MACNNNPPFQTPVFSQAGPHKELSEPIRLAGPVLFVSNAPEILQQISAGSVLYKNQLTVNPGTVVRCFIWHVNWVKDGTQFQLLASRIDADASVPVTNQRQSTEYAVFTPPSNGNLSIPGMELGCIQQFGNFDSFPSDSIIGATESVIWNVSIARHRCVASICEFTVGGSSPVTLFLRTVVIPPGGTVPSIAADPLLFGPHNRGTWPSANIQLFAIESFDTRPGVGPYSMEIAVVNDDNAPELSEATGFGKQVSDQFGKPNKGMYGGSAK